MYIEREIQKEINKFITRREVLAVVGPRQSGKTTMLSHMASVLRKKGKKVVFLTFEDRNSLSLFNDIEDFKLMYQDFDIIIIDEFQYATNAGQKLKYLFDTTGKKYIISGSSSLELTFQTGKYMVGRMITFTLFPFSWYEYLKAKDDNLSRIFLYNTSHGQSINNQFTRRLEEYILFGGYPAVVIEPNLLVKQKILSSIVDNYLLKDIKGLLSLATEDKLVTLTKLLAGQIGNRISYQELSTSTYLPYKDLLKHFEILKKTYILELITPYSTNKRTELVKNPKVYFCDTGFKNYLLEDFRSFAKRPDIGHLVENFVFSFLRRDLTATQTIRYWQTKSGAEVDFIIEKKGTLVPIEVKYSTAPTPGKSLYSFIEKYSPPKAYILTNNFSKELRIKKTRLLFIPVHSFKL